MPLPADVDTSSPRHLRDKYAIVGVGETTYTRGSGMTTRSLGTWAVRNAILDAGLKPADIDGTGAPSAVPVSSDMLHSRAYGWQSAGQMFSPTFLRHMYDYGTTPAQVAAVRAAHSAHASNNPKAYYKKRVSVEDVLASRIICKPLHLRDCCVETDNATAIIVTSADRAKDGRDRPALLRR